MHGDTNFKMTLTGRLHIFSKSGRGVATLPDDRVFQTPDTLNATTFQPVLCLALDAINDELRPRCVTVNELLRPRYVSVTKSLRPRCVTVLESLCPLCVTVTESLCPHCVTVLESLCPLCVTVTESLCPHCVTVLESLCPRCVTVLESLCPHCVTVTESLCPHCVTVTESLCPPCVTVTESLCPRCVTVRESLCPLCVTVTESLCPRCVTVTESLRPRCVSFMDPSRADWYIRQRGNYLYVEPASSDSNLTQFQKDASFIVSTDKFYPSDYALEPVHITNYYVRLRDDGDLWIEHEQYTSAYRDAASFRLYEYNTSRTYHDRLNTATQTIEQS